MTAGGWCRLAQAVAHILGRPDVKVSLMYIPYVILFLSSRGMRGGDFGDDGRAFGTLIGASMAFAVCDVLRDVVIHSSTIWRCGVI